MKKKIKGVDCDLGLGGQITTWLVCGPIPSHEPGSDPAPFPSHAATWGFEHDFLADSGGESGAAPKRGDSIELGDGRHMQWDERFFPSALIDLKKEIARKDWHLAYLACEIHMPEKAPVSFGVSSRDSLRIWIDGKMCDNFTQRAFPGTGSHESREYGWYLELDKGLHRCLVKVENRCGPWLFGMRLKMHITGTARPFIRLPGAWTHDEIRGLADGMLAEQWRSCLDMDSYYGKSQIVFRLPLETGYPLALKNDDAVFSFSVPDGRPLAARAMTGEELFDSPRVLLRIPAEDVPVGIVKANLQFTDITHRFSTLLARTDKAMECVHAFKKPSVADVMRVIEILHDESETCYNGGGVWCADETQGGRYFPSDDLHISWRTRAYCELAPVSENPVFRQRAVEGADRLLAIQEGKGWFPWWYNQGRLDRDGHPGTDHVMAHTGYIAIALTMAYELTGNRNYLEASGRAAAWTCVHGVAGNQNYNSFAVSHICAHYMRAHDPILLNAAVRKTVEGVYPDQLAYGGWAGHNAWANYHGVILHGLTMLRAALPEHSVYLPELERRIAAAVNHLLNLVQPDGKVASCFDPDEWNRNRDPSSPYSMIPKTELPGMCLLGMVEAERRCGLDVADCIYGMTGSYLAENAFDATMKTTKEKGREMRDPHGMSLLALATGYGWMMG